MPGPVSYRDGVPLSLPNLPLWEGFVSAEGLARVLGIPVALEEQRRYVRDLQEAGLAGLMIGEGMQAPADLQGLQEAAAGQLKQLQQQPTLSGAQRLLALGSLAEPRMTVPEFEAFMRADDPGAELWRTYYRHTFNPARLNPDALRLHMPGRFWRHLPEGMLIPQLEGLARQGKQRDGQALEVASQRGKRICRGE